MSTIRFLKNRQHVQIVRGRYIDGIVYDYPAWWAVEFGTHHSVIGPCDTIKELWHRIAELNKSIKSGFTSSRPLISVIR